MSGAWRDVEDISFLELRTVTKAVFDLLKYPHTQTHNMRHLFLGDNIGVVLACLRSRARPFKYIVQLRKLCALGLIMNIKVYFYWIPSELNSSDKASRILEIEGPMKQDILAHLDDLYKACILSRSYMSQSQDKQDNHFIFEPSDHTHNFGSASVDPSFEKSEVSISTANHGAGPSSRAETGHQESLCDSSELDTTAGRTGSRAIPRAEAAVAVSGSPSSESRPSENCLPARCSPAPLRPEISSLSVFGGSRGLGDGDDKEGAGDGLGRRRELGRARDAHACRLAAETASKEPCAAPSRDGADFVRPEDA